MLRKLMWRLGFRRVRSWYGDQYGLVYENWMWMYGPRTERKDYYVEREFYIAVNDGAKMNKQYEDMTRMIKEFAGTLESTRREEWYATDRDVWLTLAERFVRWRFHEDIEREKRRQTYLALKKEFEGEA